MQIHLAQENACNKVLSTVLRFCSHLHLGACPDWDWGKKWRNQNARISFYSVFPLPSTLSSAQVNTSKNVLRMTAWRGTLKCPAQLCRAGGPALPPAPSFPGPTPPPFVPARRSRTLHSCRSALAAASFLPVLPTPGPRARARARGELSGNPPRGGWPGALTSS